MNCDRMKRRRAPIAILMPISRVRSFTTTYITFATPTPAMTSVRNPTEPTKAAYEINAKRQIDKLEDDYKNERISHREYETRKKQIESNSIIY